MSKLRKEARGRECQVRLQYVCNGNDATTVLAHYRLSGISGIGHKGPDLIAAWACSACHDEVDGRGSHRYTRAEAKLAHAEGVFRTLAVLLKEGKVKA